MSKRATDKTPTRRLRKIPSPQPTPSTAPEGTEPTDGSSATDLDTLFATAVGEQNDPPGGNVGHPAVDSLLAPIATLDITKERNSNGYRVLCIGDPHFKEPTKEENDLMVKVIMSIVETIRPDHIVVLGDLLDRHKNAHLVPLRDATDFIYRLAAIAPTHVLIGNHDMLNDQQYLSPYHPFPGVRTRGGVAAPIIVSDRIEWIIPSPRTIGADESGVEENADGEVITQSNGDDAPYGRFLFLPFIPTGRMDEALGLATRANDNVTPIDESKDDGDESNTSSDTRSDPALVAPVTLDPSIRAVFCHQMFQGATFRGIKAPDGADYWPTERPLAISGHVHEYQRLGPNLVYVGTPRQSDFGDGPTVKGVDGVVVGKRKDQVEDVVPKGLSLFTFPLRSDGGKVTEERIPLLLPGYITHHVDVADMPQWKLPGAHRVTLANGTEEIVYRDRHRIFVSGPEAEVRLYLSSRECEVLQAQGVRVQEGHVSGISVEYDAWQACDAFAYLSEVERAIRSNPRELAIHQRIVPTLSAQ